MIRYTKDFNPKENYHMRGFVSIFFNTQSTTKPTTIVTRISKVENVSFAHLVTGQVDAIAFVDAQDSGSFRDALLEINSISGVDHTSTFVVL